MVVLSVLAMNIVYKKLVEKINYLKCIYIIRLFCDLIQV